MNNVGAVARVDINACAGIENGVVAGACFESDGIASDVSEINGVVIGINQDGIGVVLNSLVSGGGVYGFGGNLAVV